MAKEYILKDRHGNSRTFDKETFYVRGADGELMPFTHGTGNPVLQPLTITENGTYTAPEGVDGYNPVTVNVAGSADLHYVTFMNRDGTKELGKKAVADGDDCADPIVRGIFGTPTEESSDQHDFTFSGSWATVPNGGADANALKSVTEDRVVYANFVATVRNYTITYYDSDGTTVLKTESLAYGAMPSYVPVKEGYDFKNWVPAPASVVGEASYTAYWEAQVGFASATWDEIAQAVSDGTYVNKYAMGDTKSVTLTYADGTTETVEFEIVDMDTSNIADNTHMALLATKALATPQRYYNTTVNSSTDMYYTYSYLATYVAELEGCIPSDMNTALKTMQPQYAGKTGKLHIPTTQMLTGKKWGYASITDNTTYWLDAFKNGKSIKCITTDNTNASWWFANTEQATTTIKKRPVYCSAGGTTLKCDASSDTTTERCVRLLCFV